MQRQLSPPGPHLLLPILPSPLPPRALSLSLSLSDDYASTMVAAAVLLLLCGGEAHADDVQDEDTCFDECNTKAAARGQRREEISTASTLAMVTIPFVAVAAFSHLGKMALQCPHHGAAIITQQWTVW